MMSFPSSLEFFDEIVCLDTEFHSRDGEQRQVVAALVGRSLRTENEWRLEIDELERLSAPPWNWGDRTLHVAHYSPAEVLSFLSLGWRVPTWWMDTFAEWRTLTNGLSVGRPNLLNIATRLGIPAMDSEYKTAIRDILIRGDWAEIRAELGTILDYCAEDVAVTGQVFDKLSCHSLFDLPRALFRGRAMVQAALMQWRGIPMNGTLLEQMVERWDDIRAELAKGCPGYDGISFKQDVFAAWLEERGLLRAWPRTEIGRLQLDDATFKDMSRRDPGLCQIRDVRRTISELRLNKIAVGSDGRTRTMLSPFASRTGRFQPSTNRHPFLCPKWLRGLVSPGPGLALAYIDFSGQELAIAASLSSDPRMIEAYESGDFYIQFAILAGAAPDGATKQSHPSERNIFKTVALAVLYGISPKGLAPRIGLSEPEAQSLLRLHQIAFPRFHAWREGLINLALTARRLVAPLGWQIKFDRDDVNLRSIMNWPVQSAGSEMLRAALLRIESAGVKALTPVHDAVLIEAPISEIDDAVAATQDAMRRASSDVLGNTITMRSDAEVVLPGESFLPPSSRATWDAVVSAAGGLHV